MRGKILVLSAAAAAFVSSVFLTYLLCGRAFGPILVAPKISVDAVAPTEKSAGDEPNRDVRKIDFNNFTYDWFPKNDDVFKKKIVLRDGQNETVHLEGRRYGPLGEDYTELLVNVSYADLTGDGREEAIVTIGVSFYRWLPQCTFVFSEKNGKAVPLWKYETSVYNSGRQFRGLRVEGRELVFEEYEEGSAPACCAENYQRRKFAWNGRAFVATGLETFPYYNKTKDFKGYPSEKY